MRAISTISISEAGATGYVGRHVLAAGMLTKEIVCALPALFVLHDVLGLGRPETAASGRLHASPVPPGSGV